VWQIVQALDLMRLQIAVDQIINRLEAQARDMRGLSQCLTLGDKENSLNATKEACFDSSDQGLRQKFVPPPRA
jgi:hypothetical protein